LPLRRRAGAVAAAVVGVAVFVRAGALLPSAAAAAAAGGVSPDLPDCRSRDLPRARASRLCDPRRSLPDAADLRVARSTCVPLRGATVGTSSWRHVGVRERDCSASLQPLQGRRQSKILWIAGRAFAASDVCA
jgi:hypothetical protein